MFRPWSPATLAKLAHLAEAKRRADVLLQGVTGSSPVGGAISFNQKGNSQKGYKILWSFCYSKAVFLALCQKILKRPFEQK